MRSQLITVGIVVAALVAAMAVMGSIPQIYSGPEAASEPQAYTVSEFRRLTAGKTKAEVIAAVGKPASVTAGYYPGTQAYYYGNLRVLDDLTGVEMRPGPFVVFDSNGIEESEQTATH